MAKKKEEKDGSDKRLEAIKEAEAKRDKEQEEAAVAEAKAQPPAIKGTVVALKSFSTKRLTYTVGRKYKIGFNITEEEARGWLRAGYIEMFKLPVGPTETK